MNGVPRAVKVCASDALARGEVRIVPIEDDEYGMPREVLVLRDLDGHLRGYLNVCKHLPIPLDSGAREFLDDGKRHLVCNTHGALYRIDDGVCIEGPCVDEVLDTMAVWEDAGVVWISGEVVASPAR
jgi:nitrite reductase/ring-hydroxylating ferredoxin subunit